jgi:prolyl-tRNA editing enzyme YbaK/EbsC (Cys-tRNA(Pro) deacylase)
MVLSAAKEDAPMQSDLPASAQKVQDALREMGHPGKVVILPGSTRTAEEAAAAVGCQVSQIAKSLVFRGRDSGRPVLVIACGANRVDERLVAELIGEALAKADADFVREQTGFAIGGVPPIGHRQPILTLIDEDLLAFDEIWAAAGTSHAVFPSEPEELVRLTGGRVATTAKAPRPSP